MIAVKYIQLLRDPIRAIQQFLAFWGRKPLVFHKRHRWKNKKNITPGGFLVNDYCKLTLFD